MPYKNPNYQKEYREKNRANGIAYSKVYRETNRASLLEKKRAYHHANKVEIAKKDKKRYQENKERVALYGKQHYQKNKARISAENKLYRERNKVRIALYMKNYKKVRMTTDIQFRLAGNLRSRLNQAIKKQVKSGSCIRDLGCTISELKFYFEGQFQDGMTWENWSKTGWNIDHKIPLVFFDLSIREQFLQAVHYTNLQPLWASDNIKKGARISESLSPEVVACAGRKNNNITA